MVGSSGGMTDDGNSWHHLKPAQTPSLSVHINTENNEGIVVGGGGTSLCRRNKF